MPQLLSCCVCLLKFLSGCQSSLLTQPISIHSICHQSNGMDSTNWNQGVLLTFYQAALYVLSCCSSKTIIILFPPTRLSQNSQIPDCIPGMPRKLLLSPKAGGGEKGHEIPSVFLMAPIIMTDVHLSSLKGQQSKTAKGKKTQQRPAALQTDYKTAHPKATFQLGYANQAQHRLKIRDCLPAWEFRTCTPTSLCSCKHTAACTAVRFSAPLAKCIQTSRVWRSMACFFSQQLLAWLQSWQ